VTIGVVSLLFEPTPWSGAAAWRLRGMAVRDDVRQLGVGSALLLGLVDVVSAAGDGTIWCAARLGVEGFYRRHGFVRIGEEWEEEPLIGCHVAMWRAVPSGAPARH
jgi:predicted GNAT family N-acyltransferase